MYPYDNNQNDQYNQFSDGNSNLNQYQYHYNYTQPSDSSPRHKKKGGAAKVVALVLCCALVGGGAGVGGAALFSHFTADSGSQAGTESGSQDSSTIQRDDTDPTPVQVQQADGIQEMSLAEIYASYVDSCVCVTVQMEVSSGYFYQQQSTATASGSGFIISEDGYIVTNYHVIDGATEIKITMNDGEIYDAELVGGEELNDVAVLKVDGVSNLKPVVIGDSDDLVVGETVCTIGNALGAYSFSQTSGQVSATGRTVTMSDGTVMNMIQTDCTINSGNSGGPLFDQYGRVVGITSAKLSNNGSSTDASIEGMGFAIPINDVINIITDFMEYGYVTGRPYMGILNPMNVDDYSQTFGWPDGVYVNGVDENSCAQTAGIKQGDIITKIDDTEITSVNQMVSVKNSYQAGDTVQVTVFRSGEYLTLTLTFDEQTSESGTSQSQEDDQSSQSQEGQSSEGESGYGDGGYGYGDGNGSSGYYNPWEYFFNQW